jgi:hypothetical protein
LTLVVNQRVQELKYMADYYPQDRRVHDEMIAGLALRRTPMVKEKQSYAVDQRCSAISTRKHMFPNRNYM